MSYLDEVRLSIYNSKLKEWVSSQNSKTITPSIYPWTKTAKASTVSCYPVGGTELKPAVDFLFTETPPANGDKGPGNPSTISGVSEVKVTRCGKNLLTRNSIYETMSSRGITVSYNADGSIHLKGTAASNYFPYLWYFTSVPGVVPKVLSAGTTITISLSCSDNNVFCTLNDSPSAAAWQSGVNIYPGTPLTHTMSSDVKTAHFGIYVAKSATVDCDVYCQLEFGQTATAWEAPADEDYIINLGNTYYGGTLDVASGVMTVTWKEESYKGTESWIKDSSSTELVSVFYTTGSLSPRMSNTLPSCTHFTVNNGSVYVNTFNMWAASPRLIVRISSETANTADEFKTWLAEQYSTGTPLTVAYCLATPTTVQLDPVTLTALSQPDKYTSRLNTVYTDASAVQVGYVKSPIREEYELTQAIVAQGGNV